MYSFVIPCYNSSESIRHVVELTMEEMEKMNRREFEFVLVNDYSSSTKTMPVLKKLAEEYPCVTVLNLAKNAGQHNAIMAGLNYAKGDILIGMDDDMQTHPSQLPYLFEELEKGYDIVYGYYPEKKHSAFRNFGSWVNYISVRILIGKPKELKTSSYWVARKFVNIRLLMPIYKGCFCVRQEIFPVFPFSIFREKKENPIIHLSDCLNYGPIL